ncbi:hypothetical protein BJ878DRAFT_484232 [Calycina marina]|uniref:Uncharacterized protein n=1 Tax=Calycina marina TaxID=1763456 RepID=A0A9P7YUN2_9HELO|nr:hypothetical protein BJ878DRAFT_484232 [Calycina marina]
MPFRRAIWPYIAAVAVLVLLSVLTVVSFGEGFKTLSIGRNASQFLQRDSIDKALGMPRSSPKNLTSRDLGLNSILDTPTIPPGEPSDESKAHENNKMVNVGISKGLNAISIIASILNEPSAVVNIMIDDGTSSIASVFGGGYPLPTLPALPSVPLASVPASIAVPVYSLGSENGNPSSALPTQSLPLPASAPINPIPNYTSVVESNALSLLPPGYLPTSLNSPATNTAILGLPQDPAIANQPGPSSNNSTVTSPASLTESPPPGTGMSFACPPGAPYPTVTSIFYITETWHSTHYESTATLYSFMNAITLTSTETLSLCQQSNPYNLPPRITSSPDSFGVPHPCPGSGHPCSDCPGGVFCPPQQTAPQSGPCGLGWACAHCSDNWFCSQGSAAGAQASSTFGIGIGGSQPLGIPSASSNVPGQGINAPSMFPSPAGSPLPSLPSLGSGLGSPTGVAGGSLVGLLPGIPMQLTGLFGTGSSPPSLPSLGGGLSSPTGVIGGGLTGLLPGELAQSTGLFGTDSGLPSSADGGIIPPSLASIVSTALTALPAQSLGGLTGPTSGAILTIPNVEPTSLATLGNGNLLPSNLGGLPNIQSSLGVVATGLADQGGNLLSSLVGVATSALPNLGGLPLPSIAGSGNSLPVVGVPAVGVPTGVLPNLGGLPLPSIVEITNPLPTVINGQLGGSGSNLLSSVIGIVASALAPVTGGVIPNLVGNGNLLGQLGASGGIVAPTPAGLLPAASLAAGGILQGIGNGNALPLGNVGQLGAGGNVIPNLAGNLPTSASLGADDSLQGSGSGNLQSGILGQLGAGLGGENNIPAVLGTIPDASLAAGGSLQGSANTGLGGLFKDGSVASGEDSPSAAALTLGGIALPFKGKSSFSDSLVGQVKAPVPIDASSVVTLIISKTVLPLPFVSTPTNEAHENTPTIPETIGLPESPNTGSLEPLNSAADIVPSLAALHSVTGSFGDTRIADSNSLNSLLQSLSTVKEDAGRIYRRDKHMKQSTRVVQEYLEFCEKHPMEGICNED